MISYSQSPIVNVLAGSEAEPQAYRVHKSSLRKESSVYSAELSGKWLEDGKQVSLEGEDHIFVEAMIDWMYSRTFQPSNGEAIIDHDYFFGCYHIADQKVMCGFKNKIMDTMRSAYLQHKPLVEIHNVQKAYACDLGHTPMGKFLVKLVVHAVTKSSSIFGHAITTHGTLGSADETWKQALKRASAENRDLATDIVQEFIDHRSTDNPPWEGEGKCLFHDHGNGSSCSP